MDASSAPMVITVTAQATRSRVWMRVSGDVDLNGETTLGDGLRQLSAVAFAPVSVVVDLGGVTFAGSTLINFLGRVVATVPTGTRLVLCRPPPMTRHLIWLASPYLLANVRDELPGGGPAAPGDDAGMVAVGVGPVSPRGACLCEG